VTEARPNLGAFLLAGAMLVCLPLVAVQGPAHTTPMDAVNVLFLAVYWCVMFIRREKLGFPLIVAVWAIFLGSCAGLFNADDVGRASLVMVEDVYLYLWFVTLTHFLARQCRMGDIALVFVAVACAVALLTIADGVWGVAGGQFAGTKRAAGTFENPNMFGDYLVTAFFVTWATAAGGRPFVYLALAPLLFGIYATHSNGALMSLLGGCGAFTAAHTGLWTTRRLGGLLVVAAIAIGVVGVWHDELKQMAVDRFSGSRTEVGGAALKGADERLTLWQDVAYDVLHYPTGVGPGNFNREGGAVSGDYHAAHSEYLGMLAERSVIGLAGWLGVLGGLLAMIGRLRAAAAATGFRPFGIEALYGLLGAIAAHALVIELSHFRHTWLVFALVAAAAAQATTRLTAATAPAFATPVLEAA
jgi:hypothetical protein